MRIITQDSIEGLPASAVAVVPYFTDDTLADVPEITGIGGERLAAAMECGEARSTLYDMTFFHPDGARPGLLLIGAGNRSELEPLIMMRLAAAASRHLTGKGYSRVGMVDRGGLGPREFGQAAVHGALTGAYNSGIKKTKSKRSRHLDQINLVSPADEDGVRSGAELGEIVADASNLARDLVNLPANDLTPSALAGRAVSLAEEFGLDCEVLDEQGIAELRMGSFLGVAAGSDQPPRLILLRYGSPDAAVRLALVGKGLTFDSGGLSLKTAEGMETMKGDMGGAAAVIAAMVAIARLKLPDIAVTAYAGATENMPGGHAMRPGDVLTAITGETIEVLNTDAEGRLVLADLLGYACHQGATHIVDVATLTGGATVALGRVATLATGTPSAWVERVVRASHAGLERMWQMPLFPEYRKAMDSEIADIKNTGGRAGSPLTAAAFLSDFVDGVPWAHLDIAGTSFSPDSLPYLSRGATGSAVGTLVAIARDLAGEG